MKRKQFDGSEVQQSTQQSTLAADGSIQNAPRLPAEAADLDSYQQQAFAAVMKMRNVFVTGSGGCGKSHFIRQLVAWLEGRRRRKVAIVTPTGVTAVLIGGRTFASYFGFGVQSLSPPAMWNLIKAKKHVLKRLRAVSVLIFDEISMVSAELLDAANYCCQMARNRAPNAPFGGIQLVVCGDFSQLPPVQGRFAFHAQCWPTLQLRYVELLGNHRQASDELFHRVLHDVRRGIASQLVRNALKSRVRAPLEDPRAKPTELCSRRADAERINAAHLQQLPADTERTFEAKFKWSLKGSMYPDAVKAREEQIAKNMVTPPLLRLRLGALVMLTCNLDLEEGLANGSTGEVVSFDGDDGEPVVRFFVANDRSGKSGYVQRKISRNRWECVDRAATPPTRVYYVQVPLLLCYAITIHKAQGATLDYVRLRVDATLTAEGQAYVALSRCRTLKGIVLSSDFQASSIKMSDEVIAFYKEHNLLQVAE